MNTHITFIGGGNMAASLIGGLIAANHPAVAITVVDPNPQTRAALAANHPGLAVAETADNALQHAEIIVLAVKPQILRTVCESLANTIHARTEQPLIVSVAAGIRAGSIASWLGDEHLPIVRAMPNTPALLQAGATGLFANSAVSVTQRESAQHILQAVGIALWVETEDLIDSVTAVSGSGPAYFFRLMELMIESGQTLGLPADTARALVQHTALGAAKMAMASDVEVAELRRRVTSPGGTTERALALFDQADLPGTVHTALAGARDRSIELANQLGSA